MEWYRFSSKIFGKGIIMLPSNIVFTNELFIALFSFLITKPENNKKSLISAFFPYFLIQMYPRGKLLIGHMYNI